MSQYHETIAAYAAAISALDTDAFVACFAADCELNDPVGAPTAVGHAGARAFFEGIKPIFRSVTFAPGKIHVGGTRAAFGWEMTAEGQKGQTAKGDGIDMLEFDANGKILRSWGFWNPGPVVAALTA